MSMTVAVISPGNMGAGIGLRLAGRGALVLTSLAGRSAASAARAAAAGMAEGEPAEIAAAAAIILSVVPPGDALALAERLAPALAAARAQPVYVDCNAISPETARRVASVIAPTGALFVDGGIIGGPPTPDGKSPALYVSGPAARRVAALGDFGLDVRVLPGPVGDASALKMSYAGITKGFTALGAVMALAATRAGLADALRSELADSQPALFAWLSRSVPRMYPKAYRWIAEMEEIAQFIGDPDGASLMLAGAARLYAQVEADRAGDARQTGARIAALDAFFDWPT